MTRDQLEQVLDAIQHVWTTLREEQSGMSDSAFGSLAAVVDNVAGVIGEVDIVEFCSYTGDVTYRKPGLGLYD